jgi:hypothetical protein
VWLLSTNRQSQSVKSPTNNPTNQWGGFGACGGLLGPKCHSRASSGRFLIRLSAIAQIPGAWLNPSALGFSSTERFRKIKQNAIRKSSARNDRIWGLFAPPP